jgi:tetratricopeptide (TPR) repeat protein
LNWAISRFLRRLADAHRHMGNAYGNRQEHCAAVGNYTRAIIIDPTYTYCYFSRGVLHWRELGDYEAAIEDLSRVIELDPTWAEAHFNRALAYKMNMQYDRAIADFQRYLDEGSDQFWLDRAQKQLEELDEIAAAGDGA